MKIVHLIFSLHFGGAETMLVDIVNKQVQHAAVKLIIINDRINEALFNTLHKDVSVVRLNRQAGSKNPLPLLKLNKEMYVYQPDVIHCHNNNMVNVLVPFLRKKAVLTIHAMGDNAANFPKYKRCFAISQAVMEDVEKRSGIKSGIIYNGICLKDIQPRTHLSGSTHTVKMLQVGRLQHEIKGQHIAIHSLKRLREEGRMSFVNLDFIGDGPSLEYLQGLSRELGVCGHVRFLGQRDRAYIYSHLKEYDLLLQPSLSEGFGLTVAEAMAARLPVVVSDIDGPMEVIGGGDYGDYFETDNADSLAEKISQIVFRDKAEEKALLDRAYAYCHTHFDLAATALKYIDAYKTI